MIKFWVLWLLYQYQQLNCFNASLWALTQFARVEIVIDCLIWDSTSWLFESWVRIELDRHPIFNIKIVCSIWIIWNLNHMTVAWLCPPGGVGGGSIFMIKFWLLGSLDCLDRRNNFTLTAAWLSHSGLIMILGIPKHRIKRITKWHLWIITYLHILLWLSCYFGSSAPAKYNINIAFKSIRYHVILPLEN